MNYPNFAGHTISIETPRLVLRPLESADIGIALHYYQDPEVKLAMEGNADTFLDLNGLECIFEYMARRGYLFTVLETTTGEAIGELCLEWMNLSRADVRPRERVMRVPLGIWDKARWGQGYGTEMLQRAMQYAFEHFRLDRLCAMDVAKTNVRSKALFMSCGFSVVREREGESFIDLQITRNSYLDNTRVSDEPTNDSKGCDELSGLDM